MGRDDVLQMLQDQPFHPFRILLSTELIYEIRHPDLVYVGRSALFIGVPPVGHNDLFGKHGRVALLHVVRLEPMPIPTPPSRTVPSLN